MEILNLLPAGILHCAVPILFYENAASTYVSTLLTLQVLLLSYKPSCAFRLPHTGGECSPQQMH